MANQAIPSFHLQITEKVIPDAPYLYLDVEWFNAPKKKRALKPNTVKSPLNESYKGLIEVGQALYRCLFEGQIGVSFRAYCQKYCTDSESPGLRLILDFMVDPSQPNLLINLPWELLHDDKDWLLSNPKLSIVRRFNVQPREDEVKASQGIKPPMRVLFAYAEPPDKPSVNVKDSFDAASETIESAIELVELEVLSHVTAEKLKSQVKQGPHIIHLLGHGDMAIQGLFYLEESETATADILTAREFRDWIKESAVKPRLVVLTACHSGNPGVYGILGLATRLLDAGVEAVVSMQTALYTDEARDFTRAFYHALVTSFSVDDAVRAGRQALRKYQSATDVSKLIHSSLEHTAKDDQPLGRWRPMSFTTLINDKEILNTLSLPAWSVPTLFLQGEGWLGLELPESPFTWPVDSKAMIYVEEGRFYVDKYPVTREEYRKFARATNRPIPNWGEINESCLEDLFSRYLEITDAIKKSWEPNLPATGITLEDAKAYAAWAGKHLPTPNEWQEAALSGCPDKRASYPWGNNLTERVCNTREARFNQLWPVILSEQFDNCSKAGVCDVVGNASGWTQDKDGQVYVCGGSFKDWGEKCTVQTRRLITASNLTGDSIGFRCAASLTEWMNILSKKAESESV